MDRVGNPLTIIYFILMLRVAAERRGVGVEIVEILAKVRVLLN